MIYVYLIKGGGSIEPLHYLYNDGDGRMEQLKRLQIT